MRSVLFAAPLLVASSYGAFDSCGPSDYDAAFQSFMQGFQSDTSATDTECYEKVTVYTGKVRLLAESIQTLDLEDLIGPLYNASDLTVAATDLFTYCQTTDLAKQLAIKFSTLAGFADLVATIGVAFFQNYQEPDDPENVLYTAIMGVNSASTCEQTANYMGQVIHYSFNYEVQPANYVDQLSQNLVDDMFAS